MSANSLPELDRRPSFIGWVGGEESELEQAQLEALGVPGLVIGPAVDGVASLGTIEPGDHPDPIALVRAALQAIRRLTDDVRGSQGLQARRDVAARSRAGSGA